MYYMWVKKKTQENGGKINGKFMQSLNLIVIRY